MKVSDKRGLGFGGFGFEFTGKCFGSFMDGMNNFATGCWFVFGGY